MRYQVHVFRIVFFIFCLCIFGSTKSSNAFDSSNSTAIQAPTDLVTQANAFMKGQNVELVKPPQPRNKRGEFVCTKNRYIQNEVQVGHASWYGGSFHGQETANGETFNQNARTLAHLTLPMGTEVLVENPENGTIIRARVNDCGPYVEGRIFDLSRGLALELGILKKGVGTVHVTVL